ncbi:MAG: sensor histidine kinase, partial [Cyanobacteria bacterium]|nr:sensor histidine kinase [Cyanobacteriota bacterium]
WVFRAFHDCKKLALAMYNLTRFSLSEMTECGAILRKLGIGAASMEAVANSIVHHFYNQFLDPETGQSALALVRFFKTHAYSDLPTDLQPIATQMLGSTTAHPGLKCLTLLATTGDRPEWNARTASTGHQVIPLPSERMVTQAPMIAQLIQQLGLTINNVLAPDPDLLVDLQERTYNVFHIPNAINSSYIPAQAEFVAPCKIQSVLGFGGMLPSGNLMAIILFSKLPIQRDTAELFKPLALNAKMAILPFSQGPIFASPSA